MLEQSPEGVGGVGPTDFLARVFRSRFVTYRDLKNRLSKPDCLRGYFWAEFKSAARKIHAANKVDIESFVAGRFIRHVLTKKNPYRPC